MLSFIASLGAMLPGLFGKTVGPKVARLLGFVILALVLVAVLSLGKCAYDKSVIEDHEVKREAKAAPAREKAADRRVEDTQINTKKEEELHAKIDAAPKGGTLSPAARTLACERLRRQGRIPPACRPAGGDGGEAGSN